MKRLTLNQDSEIRVKDVYGKMHDCKDVPNEFYGCIRKLYDYKDVPNEFYGCIRKLYDYENTGYNPDFIDTISYILEYMKDLL